MWAHLRIYSQSKKMNQKLYDGMCYQFFSLSSTWSHKRLNKAFDIINMMPKRGESQLLIPGSCLPYPFQCILQDFPALCLALDLLEQIALGHSPALSANYSLIQPLFESLFGTMGLSDFLWLCITVLLLLNLQCAPCKLPRSGIGYPSSCAKSYQTCSGSPTSRNLNMTYDYGIPSMAFRQMRLRHSGVCTSFSGLIPSPRVPLSTLQIIVTDKPTRLGANAVR